MEKGDFRSVDLQKGRELLKAEPFPKITFSQGAYQVEIKEGGQRKSYHPFFHIADSGELVEGFCSCKTAETHSSCPHLAAGFLAIFSKEKEPLHVRFDLSFWKQIFWICFYRHGTEVFLGPKGLVGKNLYGNKLLSIEGSNKSTITKLHQLIEQHPESHEENSIKFSALSELEIARWKRGETTINLQFELSFWADLAKWFLELAQEKQSYTISFEEEKGQLPHLVVVAFKELKFSMQLTRANWHRLIPSLTTVKAPLAQFADREKIVRQILFFPLERVMRATYSNNPNWDCKALQIPIENFTYLQGRGFFPKEESSFTHSEVLDAAHIAYLLGTQRKFLESKLKGEIIHKDPISVRYSLSFDEKGTLQIKSYLFEKDDFDKEGNGFYEEWAYIVGKGFFTVAEKKFSETKVKISPEKLSEFISQNRLWLSHFEGFSTHFSDLDSKLSYKFNSQGSLQFYSDINLSFDEEVRDFGEWVYLKGRGFFSKFSGETVGALRSGTIVARDKIGDFIEKNRDELEQVEGFFAVKNPVLQTGLRVVLTKQEQILVQPLMQFHPRYDKQLVEVFGNYTYVGGEGFSLISPKLQLPPLFRAERKIAPSEEKLFFTKEIEFLKPYLIEMDPRLVLPARLDVQINHLKSDPKLGKGAWIVNLDYVGSSGRVSPYLIWQALAKKKERLFSEAGVLFLDDSRFQWLCQIKQRRWLKKGQELRITTLDFLKLSIYEKFLPPDKSRWGAKESARLMEELTTLHTSEEIVLTGFGSKLRSYQESGLKWLFFLYCHGLSGLLCDDMGLGKTHQAMALLAAASNDLQRSKKKAAFLVVCPTSVIYHWEELLKRFFPSLKVAIFYGAARSLEGFHKQYDLLLTSYGTLRQEAEKLSKLSFDIAVFDEVQVAKNLRSQTHKALRGIDAKMRLGLSGTPIENELVELKALFDLVLPGFMPQLPLFRELFITPIEREGSKERQQLLKKWVHPFILRRKKSEVLLELPSKIEEIAYCTLSDEQKKLYSKVVADSKENLLRELEDEKRPVNYLHVFAMLSKLKQICNHPCLETGEVEKYKEHTSGKWDLFCQLLEEALASSQKVVVFSQYLTMLDIIEKHLKEKRIKFAGIRGSTSLAQRKVELTRFRDDPKCEVFVASLQAAGVGVDLVSASVVIHYDRWWNPAKEDQATDRVHRMGQSRGVQVFKLVCKNSIEERIDELIQKKKGLAESVIGYDDQDLLKRLSRQELLHLLKTSDTF